MTYSDCCIYAGAKTLNQARM